MDEGRPFPLLPNTTAAWPWERGSQASDRAAAGEAPLPEIANGHASPLASREAASGAAAIAADGFAVISAALAAERERTTGLERQIRALVADGKSMRRQVLALRVGRWRDEEAIAELQSELAQTRQSRDAAIVRGRQLAREIALVSRRPWLAFFKARGARPNTAPPAAMRQASAVTAPFFMRGFQLDDATAIINGAARRARNAPAGTMIYGPYIALPAGTYCAVIDARLYRFPAMAGIKVDVVCDRARRLIEQRRFVLHPLARLRRLQMPFTIWEGEDYADFELRIWAPNRAALEITRIGLHSVREAPAAAEAASDVVSLGR